MLKKQKRLLISLGILLLFQAAIFSTEYFHIISVSDHLVLNPPLVFVLYFVLAFAVWILYPMKPVLKAFVIFATFILSILISAFLLYSTMYLPGSKEHNYVMYNVCLPAIRKAYEEKTGKKWPPSDGLVNKEGNGRWWFQHSECEQSIWAGKGPIFSENPKDFIPVKKNPTPYITPAR